jgi:hypothetical protein
MSLDELKAKYIEALRAGQDDLAASYLQQIQAAQAAPEAAPAMRAPVEPRPFAPPYTTRQAMEEEAAAQARALTERRAVGPVEREQEREQEQQRAMELLQIERERPVQPGVGPVRQAEQSMIPMLRTTRIVRLPVYRDVPPALKERLTPEEIARLETREPLAGTDAQPIAERLYYRTPTGIREPTRGEQLVETFAQQELLTEAQARQQAQMRSPELQAALRGEGALPLSSVPGLALEALTQQTTETAPGVVETPLAATLRGFSSLMSATVGEAIGTQYESAGVGTRRKEATTMDPEARRRASSDPDFVDRVLENLATGRGIADEIYDADVFRNAAGDVAAGVVGEEYRQQGELGAFYAGLGLDLVMPGYIGTAKLGSKAAARVGQPLLQAARPEAQRLIARNIINQSPLDEADKTAALQAIRASDGSEAGIAAAVQPHLGALGGDAGDAFAAELRSRIPADYVFVTDSLAVPRPAAAQARQAAQQAQQRATQRTTDGQAEYLRTLAALADDTAPDVSTRMGALADRHFPGAAGQQVRSANLSAVQGDTAQQLRLAADALEKKPTAAARTAANRALQRMEQESGMQAGTLQRRLTERAPAEIADTLPESMRQQVRQAESWAALDARVQDDAFDALRNQAAIDAARSAGITPRTAQELTNLQVAVRDLNDWVAASQRVNDGTLARWIRAVTRKQPLPPASVARAVDKVRSTAQSALRSAEQQIVNTTRQTGSVNRGYEDFFARNTADMSGEEQWTKVLETLIGGENMKAIMVQAKRKFALDSTPVTVENVRQVYAQLAKGGFATGVPITATPIRNSLLKSALDEGVRRRLVSEGIALETRLATQADELLGVRTPAEGLPRWSTLVPDSQIPVQVPGGVRVYSSTASRAERQLAELAQELVPYLANVQPASRASWRGALSDVGQWAFGANRSFWVNARYGYAGLPNLPFLLYRLTEAPILSLATIGAQRTLSGLQRMTRTKLTEVMQQLGSRRMGAGITSNGRYLSPAQLQREIDEFGIGITTVDAQRVINLAKDLERAATAATAGKAGRALRKVTDQFNPLARGFWLQVADSVEYSYRRSVFEGARAAGYSAQEAADIARRSLGDFGAQPQVVQYIGQYLSTAQTAYNTLSEMVFLAAKNPASMGAITRAALGKQKAADPYNIDGDEALTRLGIVRAGEDTDAQRFYGPRAPLFLPVESALRVMRHTDVLIRDLLRAAKSGDVQQARDAFMEGGVKLLTVPFPVFGAFIDSAGIEAGEPLTLADPVSAERTFWLSMAAARAADPDGSAGIWDAWDSIARPQVVLPPDVPGIKHPTLPDVWLRQPPEGTPHILWAFDVDGNPLYKVFEPSPRGLQNIELARTATPDSLERALGAFAALVDLPAGASLPGESIDSTRPPVQVYGGAQVPTGMGAAAGMLLGRPAGPGDPAAARRAQIEQLRQTREGSQ